MANAIGIDFGTTKTMVSFFNPVTSQAELARLGRDRDSIPTTVHQDEAGELLFGEDADDQIATDPEGYCRAFKLHLGESDSVLPRIGATAEELAKRFLCHVKEECQQNVFQGEPVTAATITVPVAFSPSRKAALKRAAEAAGFSNVSFVPEPEAAGTAFLRDNPTDKFSRALVLDWGGGTLDIAVISRNEDGAIHADRHCAEGRDDVGGEEMDRRLLVAGDEYWNETFGFSLLASEENEPRLLREAEKVKIGLSRKDSVTFRRGTRKIDVSRTQFRQIIGEMLDTAVGLVKSALAKNKEQGNPEPDAILLIGGTSQVPSVREAMEANFPNLRVLSWHHSHEAVALGATRLPDIPQNEAPSSREVSVPTGGSDEETTASSPELAVVKWGETDTSTLPEPFCEAPNALGEGFASLGIPLSKEIVEYHGYGSPCKALKMQNGLLVWRSRLGRFCLVPNIPDGEEIVDILVDPENIDMDGFESDDNPFRIHELECMEKMEGQREELHRQQGAMDWYQANDSAQYGEKRKQLQLDLANMEAEKKKLEAQLELSKNTSKSGIFASVGAWWKENGIKVDIDNAKEKIEQKIRQIKDNDEEADRHSKWPIDEHSATLAKDEGAYHAVFREYCIARHFRGRMVEEVEKRRETLDELAAEIEGLRDSAATTESEIAEMERKLPIMKLELTNTKNNLANKEKNRKDLETELKKREQTLTDSFTSTLSQTGTFTKKKE